MTLNLSTRQEKGGYCIDIKLFGSKTPEEKVRDAHPRNRNMYLVKSELKKKDFSVFCNWNVSTVLVFYSISLYLTVGISDQLVIIDDYNFKVYNSSFWIRRKTKKNTNERKL